MRNQKNSATKRQKRQRKVDLVVSLFKTYWIGFVILFLVINFGVNQTIKFKYLAQSCMTRAMVSADSRCLYIYQQNVYQMGSRSNPHKGNSCGTDVTSIIPSFHYLSAAQYLSPNYAGVLCSDVTASPTPLPTTVPTIRPTNTIAPTSTIRPTNTMSPTATTRPTINPTVPPTVIPTKTIEPTPTTLIPTSIPNPPSWFDLIPTSLRNFLNFIYVTVFFFNRPSNYLYLLEGIVPTPTP